MRRHHPVVPVVLLLLLPLAANGQTDPARPRAAAVRALPMLQRSVKAFVENRSCVSCHHNSVAVLALHMAQREHLAVDAAVLEAVETKTFRQLRSATAVDDAIQAVSMPDPTPGTSYLLMAAQAADLPRDLATETWAARIARWQFPDGHWTTSDFRPPHSGSQFTATATAVQALRAYMPAELASDRDRAVERAATWLRSTRPLSTEDAAFRLMGLASAGASADDLKVASADLVALQRPDGGWPQIPGYPSDAYSTGQALVALHDAGASTADRAAARGVAFLVSSQARDGTWRVRTRMISPAEVSPMYFATGFPYGKDEFLSFTGSCWAVMGLLSMLPDAPVAGVATQPAAPPAMPAWVRTALFEPPAALAALLNAGLDPNARTAGGTTLLMASAWDPEKVRLLIQKGADVTVRSPSGADAISAATGIRGSTSSLVALLDAGAPANPPDAVRVRRSPIVLASMSGDVENVRLLLARGATASAEAAAEAVTFGYADVLGALVAAGVDVSGAESTGVNLLHWATITNRAAIIPILLAAGVPLDDVDGFGFTPLMYAATLDHGETSALQALLAAGADRGIKNEDGRTPLQQAQRLGHPQHANVLKQAR
ncbi:MAG TPA: ankyrin repeat domain-containing protein [Vicinamibacterales bacterium]|nr:ankyrin repeat domain-containing protein [Vicinamibacterales bacterium]